METDVRGHERQKSRENSVHKFIVLNLINHKL